VDLELLFVSENSNATFDDHDHADIIFRLWRCCEIGEGCIGRLVTASLIRAQSTDRRTMSWAPRQFKGAFDTFARAVVYCVYEPARNVVHSNDHAGDADPDDGMI